MRKPRPRIRGVLVPGLCVLAYAAVLAFTAKGTSAYPADRYTFTLWVLLTAGLIAILAIAILRHRLERQAQTLQRSDALFRNTLENLPLLVVALNANGIVTFCNETLLTVLGRKKEDIIGQPWDERFVSLSCADDQTPVLLDTPRMQLRIRHENYLRAAATEKRFVSWYNTVLHDEAGAFAGTISIGEDITKRKKLQEELERASEAAAAASRAKSEFLANMSHEIRTPMNGIVGMTDLVLESPLNEDQRENLQIVKSSADSLLTIINDILDFSKIEAGKLALDPIPFNLEDVVWESLGTLAVSAHKKGIELTSRVAGDVRTALIGDPGRLRQVLLNLLGNALKFTEQGEVALDVSVEEQSDERAVLHFCVSDSGIGMSPEQQTKIFEAFSQAELSIARQFGGTGLGLTICARLVQMFEGRIWVESALGKGSKFHFTASFSFSTEPSSARIICLESAARALVLDDHVPTREALIETLTGCGVDCVPATGGKSAIEEIQRALEAGTPYDLLIVDLHMPGMDGFEVARQLRSILPVNSSLKIVLLTSVGQRGDAVTCRELGIEAYLRKPFKPSELRQCVWTLLEAPAKRPTPLITRHSLREDRLRILLAEDGRVNQCLAVKLLEKKGHSVVVANNGREAVDYIEQNDFDIVFMDLEMPVMDGFEAVRIIRQREEAGSKRIRIIAMTAHAIQGHRERCLTAGMDAYISKPIRAEELYALLAA